MSGDTTSTAILAAAAICSNGSRNNFPISVRSTRSRISGPCRGGESRTSGTYFGHRCYQGRFKSFPVGEDEYFLMLCRYVEANALRAKLVERAEQWPWSGLWRRLHRARGLLLSPWPVDRPRGWVEWVNAAMPKERSDALRDRAQRGRPFGSAAWVETTAARLGFTLRGPGRPRKAMENQ